MITVRGMPPAQARVLLACIADDPIVTGALLAPSTVDPARCVVRGMIAGGVPFTVGSIRDWIGRLRARGGGTVPVARARSLALLAVADRLAGETGLPDVSRAEAFTGLAMVYTLLEYAARDLAGAYAERARAAHLGIGGPG